MSRSPTFIHQALLYASEEEFLSAAVLFVETGLAQGEQVFVMTDAGKLASVRDVLGPEARDVGFMNHADWYDAAPARRLNDFCRQYREQQQAGAAGRIRVMGEPIWSRRTPAETREWKRYESLVNMAYASFPVLALCAYDTRVLPPSILADAYRTHPEVLNGVNGEPSPQFMDPRAFVNGLDEREGLPEPETIGSRLSLCGNLARLRRFIAEEATRAGVRGTKLGELQWVANEVATNVLWHGGGSGTVRTWSGPAEFICEISDRGPGFEDPLTGWLPAPAPQEIGSGLWLAHQLCDLVEVLSSASGTTVRLHTSL